MKLIFKLFYNVFAALILGMAISHVYGGQPWQIALIILAVGLLFNLTSRPIQSVASMAIQVEFWQRTIEQEIFKDNNFYMYSKDASDKVSDGKVVHIPQSGGSGEVQKNRSVKPAVVRQRNDSDVIYLLDEFTTEPTLIEIEDEDELSYDKRVSVLDEDLQALNEYYAETMFENWTSSGAWGVYVSETFPTANIITVTGENGTNNADAIGASGNRKMHQRLDLQMMRKRFQQENRWSEGKMIALLTPEAQVEMYPANDPIVATLMQNVTEEERRNGVFLKDYGWKIMIRSSVMRTDAAGNIKYIDEVGAATDHSASLFWNEGSVEHAKGKATLFQNLKDPQYYGDIYSIRLRGGGRCKRADWKGIKMLRQEVAA